MITLKTEKIPALDLESGRLIMMVEEWEAHRLIQEGLAHLVRDSKGFLRRIYVNIPKAKTLASLRGTSRDITTDASRTVRKQHLNDTHWTYQHITNDLDEKRDIQHEEHQADGIFSKEAR